MMVPEPENDPFSQNAVCLLGWRDVEVELNE